MPRSYDVIVAGLGAMGSAAACHLARQGLNVLGLDPFSPPHTMGSSHGQTRIIREAYFEDPAYVPLVQRAYELWHSLEAETNRNLLIPTGGLLLGSPDSAIIQGARQSADQHGLPCELLSGDDIVNRFPVFRPLPGMVGVLEPRAGALKVEDCVQAHLDVARRHGADLRGDEALAAWEPDGAGVSVRTGLGQYTADKLVLSCGSWLPQLWPACPLPLQVERQVLYWFKPGKDAARDFDPSRCPVHIWEFEEGRYFYGFPDLGYGVKMARHHEGEVTSPEQVRREVSEAETDSMRELLRPLIPELGGELVDSTVCLYTNTPDHHFLVDRVPEHPQVLVASPCSGHGFKFSSVMGEILCYLCQDKDSPLDIDLFKLSANRAGSPDGP